MSKNLLNGELGTALEILKDIEKTAKDITTDMAFFITDLEEFLAKKAEAVQKSLDKLNKPTEELEKYQKEEEELLEKYGVKADEKGQFIPLEDTEKYQEFLDTLTKLREANEQVLSIYQEQQNKVAEALNKAVGMQGAPEISRDDLPKNLKPEHVRLIRVFIS